LLQHSAIENKHVIRTTKQNRPKRKKERKSSEKKERKKQKSGFLQLTDRTNPGIQFKVEIDKDLGDAIDCLHEQAEASGAVELGSKFAQCYGAKSALLQFSDRNETEVAGPGIQFNVDVDSDLSKAIKCFSEAKGYTDAVALAKEFSRCYKENLRAAFLQLSSRTNPGIQFKVEIDKDLGDAIDCLHEQAEASGAVELGSKFAQCYGAKSALLQFSGRNASEPDLGDKTVVAGPGIQFNVDVDSDLSKAIECFSGAKGYTDAVEVAKEFSKCYNKNLRAVLLQKNQKINDPGIKFTVDVNQDLQKAVECFTESKQEDVVGFADDFSDCFKE